MGTKDNKADREVSLYRIAIVDMVRRVNNPLYMRQIYTVVQAVYKQEKRADKE